MFESINTYLTLTMAYLTGVNAHLTVVWIALTPIEQAFAVNVIQTTVRWASKAIVMSCLQLFEVHNGHKNNSK